MNISKMLTDEAAADGFIRQVLHTAIETDTAASDIFIVVGAGIAFKRDGRLQWPFGDGRPQDHNTIDDSRKDAATLERERLEKLENGCVMFMDAQKLVQAVYRTAFPREAQQDEKKRHLDTLLSAGDDDFSFSVAGLGRFRCNAYRQRGSLACTIRVFPFGLPDFSRMHYPPQVTALAQLQQGMVLVTGQAGSGKSTTLAHLIDHINNDPNRSGHIVTVEDPIEYIYRHNYSLISQREVEHDTESFASALKAVLRQAPNVILVGEMRDFETIQTAVTAAETGQLVLSTLHTLDVANTIDRIIDVFPPLQQQQIRMQLSMVLKAVVSQEMVDAIDPNGQKIRVPIFEVLRIDSSIAPLIRTGRTQQLNNYFKYNAAAGMLTKEVCRRQLEAQGIQLLG
jgi:twitching motility protein PilT